MKRIGRSFELFSTISFTLAKIKPSRGSNVVKGTAAFTLAEILITLGIIGIVAAITIVPLVQKYQHKVLETQFKKSVALINQIVLRTKYDLGTDYLAKFCTEHPDGVQYINWQTCTDTISKNLMLFSTINKTSKNTKYSVDRRNDTIKTYNGKNELTYIDTAFFQYFLLI